MQVFYWHSQVQWTSWLYICVSEHYVSIHRKRALAFVVGVLLLLLGVAPNATAASKNTKTQGDQGDNVVWGNYWTASAATTWSGAR
jgi:hypothetical protein